MEGRKVSDTTCHQSLLLVKQKQCMASLRVSLGLNQPQIASNGLASTRSGWVSMRGGRASIRSAAQRSREGLSGVASAPPCMLEELDASEAPQQHGKGGDFSEGATQGSTLSPQCGEGLGISGFKSGRSSAREPTWRRLLSKQSREASSRASQQSEMNHAEGHGDPNRLPERGMENGQDSIAMTLPGEVGKEREQSGKSLA